MRTTIAFSGAGLALGLALGPATAVADSTTAPVRPLVMSDLSGLTMIGVDMQLTRWETQPILPTTEGTIDHTSFSFDVVGDISVAPHWVIFARLPLSYVSIEDEPPAELDCCGTAIGNFTLGVRALDSGMIGSGARRVLGVELSASVPTAADEDEAGLASLETSLAHLPHDPGRYLPNTTTLRLGGAAQIYGEHFMVQGNAGVDAFIYDTDSDDDTDFALRLGVAAGFRATYELAILAEVGGLIALDDGILGDDNDGVGSFDVGLRYASESFVAGLRAYVPLDDLLRDLDMLGVGVDLGVRL